MTRLSDDDVREQLRARPGWELSEGRLRRQYELASFREAIAFVNRVAELAEAADHHPDILIEYRKVTLTLISHDSGGLTSRDFKLAGQIDA